MAGVYTYVKALTNPSTSNVILQFKAGTSLGYRIHRIRVTQSGSTTSANGEIKVQRLSSAATVSAAAASDYGARSSREPSIGLSFGTTATGFTGSGAGTTTGGELLHVAFNLLNGIDDYPVPEDRIEIPAGGILAIYTPVAPAATYTFEVTIEELG